jgi:HK97 family phage prohead protease
MECKIISFQLMALSEKTGIFEGTAAVFSYEPDAKGDIFCHGAFKKTLREGGGRLRILFDQEARELVGRPLEMAEGKNGLFIKGKLSLEIPRAREALGLLRDGKVTSIVLNFDAISTKAPVFNGIRHLREVRLWDFSLVSPAGYGVVTQEKRATDKPLESEVDDFDAEEAEARIDAMLKKLEN